MGRISDWWSSLKRDTRATAIVGIAAAIIGLVGTIAAAFIGMYDNPRDQEIPPTVSASPVAPSANSALPATPAQLADCPPVGQSNVKLANVSYFDEGKFIGPIYYSVELVNRQVFLGFGIPLKSKIPPEENFFVLWAADHTTTDSTPGHKPGDGVYYRFHEFVMTENCWFRKSDESMPNKDANGLTYQIAPILVDDEHLEDFKNSPGFNDNALNSLEVTRLAYFEIPTNDL